MDAYRSGDPYLAFAKQAGAVPLCGTKSSHRDQRSRFKSCALAVQYGMGVDSLALRIDRTRAHANELLELHRTTYPMFWRYSDRVIEFAMLHGYIDTVFGWRLHVVPDTNPRTLRNFPGQGNGSEMLRVACVLAGDRGVSICATIHDAVLIQAPAEQLADAVHAMQDAMREASAIVLDGFTLTTDVKTIVNPDRFMDAERGRAMWDLVWDIVFDITGVRIK